MRTTVSNARGKLLFSLFGAMVGVLAARAVTVSGTPDAYLDYIEATGQQYIDTEVNAETGLKARADFSRTARSLLPHHINRYTIMLIMSISILKASIAIMIFPIRKIYLFPNNNNIFVRKNEFL